MRGWSRRALEAVLDESGPLALGLEYGAVGFVIGVAVWLVFGLVVALIVGISATVGLARGLRHE
jgi:hypothetical protein